MAEQVELDRLAEARQQVRQFRDLQQLPGWVALVEAARAQIENRRRKYNLQPLEDQGALLKQQWELGEASGMDLFTRLPGIVIESALAILEEAKGVEGSDGGS